MTASRNAFSSSSSGAIRVLGIDPGTRVLGYGVLDVDKRSSPRVVAHGALRLPRSPLAVRLELIFREVESIISAHRPQVLALEEVFHGKNFQSVLKVGEARGVVVLAAQISGLEIQEYSPALIKKSATGNGNAAKAQVQGMMKRVLGLKEALEPPDVADALAAAFCHGQRVWRGGESGGVGKLPRERVERRGARSVKGRPKSFAALLRARKARVLLGKSFRKG
jgi:crossover junction endodeoxyribonuclease RuvC